MRSNNLTITDQFCGAGGSSLGASKYLVKVGGEIKLALNHWKLAIETHNTNFPDTLHECTDISACDPRRYPRTTGLISSPECTNHSLAKGKKAVKSQLDLFDKGVLDPAAERSRATMWDVPRFAEYHKYEFIIIENVVDARKWVQFPAWLMAMDLLGYNHKCVYANSMHFQPTPQSRDRMYIVFWKKGNKSPNLDLRPLAFSPKLGRDVEAVQWWKNSQKKFGKYRQQYLYRCPETHDIVEPYYHAAFNIIDWSNIGTRIGDRKKPLSANTEKRIKHGLEKYGKDPFLFHAAYSEHARGVTRSLQDPAFTQTTFDSQAIAMPFIFKGEHTLQDGYVRDVLSPIQTQTVRQSMGVVMPYIIEMNKTGECKPANNPTSTFTAGGINHAVLQQPFIINTQQQTGVVFRVKSVTDVLPTQSTQSAFSIITPDSWRSFLHYHYGQTTLSGITDAIGTATTKDRHSIVSFQEPKYEDCYYRMLMPHEIQAAMAFDANYKILGSGKDKVKQLGNAVTPPAMEWLVQRCVESLN